MKQCLIAATCYVMSICMGLCQNTATVFIKGTTWTEVLVDLDTGTPEPLTTVTFEIGSDTVIDGLRYYHVLKNGVEQTYLVRASTDKVYVKDLTIDAEVMIYDFSTWKNERKTKFVSQFIQTSDATDTDYSTESDIIEMIPQQHVMDGGVKLSYITDGSTTIVQSVGRIYEQNRNSCLLGYTKDSTIIPWLSFWKVLWIKDPEDNTIYSVPCLTDMTPFTSETMDINYIPNPENHVSVNRIYNLQGQRMAQPQTGLNIVGGCKVLVR